MKMKNNEIVQAIEKAGYRVVLNNWTKVKEVSISTIDGEEFEKDVAFSSKDNDYEFLMSLLEDTKNKPLKNICYCISCRTL